MGHREEFGQTGSGMLRLAYHTCPIILIVIVLSAVSSLPGPGSESKLLETVNEEVKILLESLGLDWLQLKIICVSK